LVLDYRPPPCPLPPSPTRRSSDLGLGEFLDLLADLIRLGLQAVLLDDLGDDQPEPYPPLRLLLEGVRRHRQVLHVDAAPLQILRSEEHTSELQSRENLVCRLLLEK